MFRPEPTRAAALQSLSGKPIHATGQADANGETEIVLQDGTRVRAKSVEIVAE